MRSRSPILATPSPSGLERSSKAMASRSKKTSRSPAWFLATRVKLGFIDRSQMFRPVFSIEPGAKAKLTNLTISGGTGGGITNQGSLTLTNVWVRSDLNRSTQHLLILPDEEVCAWMHGPGSRRNRRLSCGSAGRAVNV